MAKELFSDNIYMCPCGGEIQVHVSDEPSEGGSIYKTDDGQQVEFKAKCSNEKCVFMLAVINMDGWPYPCMISMHPLPNKEEKEMEKKIINLAEAKLDPNKVN